MEEELVSVSVPLDLARGDTVESMMTNVDVSNTTTYWNIAAQPSQVKINFKVINNLETDSRVTIGDTRSCQCFRRSFSVWSKCPNFQFCHPGVVIWSKSTTTSETSPVQHRYSS